MTYRTTALFNKIKGFISGRQGSDSIVQIATDSNDMSSSDLRQREIEIIGEAQIRQQRLYEKWIIKDVWHMKNEALPLLLGFDPEIRKRSMLNEKETIKIDELWEHAQRCVEQGHLTVKNKENSPDDWQIPPMDIYRWAIVSRVEVPASFTALMEFISSTIKQPAKAEILSSSIDHNIDPALYIDRERVLGAALAILAATPEQCKNNNGKIQAGRIVEIINEKGEFWFGNDAPSLSKSAMTDLINRWLKTVC